MAVINPPRRKLAKRISVQCIGTSIAGAVGTTVVAVGNIAVMDVIGILELVFFAS